MSATVTSIATPRPDTHHFIGAVPIAFCARFVEEARQRNAERRMLRTVRQLDHAGVLADVEAACGGDDISRG
jgi:hypothetical protein